MSLLFIFFFLFSLSFEILFSLHNVLVFLPSSLAESSQSSGLDPHLVLIYKYWQAYSSLSQTFPSLFAVISRLPIPTSSPLAVNARYTLITPKCVMSSPNHLPNYKLKSNCLDMTSSLKLTCAELNSGFPSLQTPRNPPHPSCVCAYMRVYVRDKIPLFTQ